MYSTQFRRILFAAIILSVHFYDGVESSPNIITKSIHHGFSRMMHKLSTHQKGLTKLLCSYNTSQIIDLYGYSVEEHEVTTPDGYILKLFRCNSRESSDPKGKRVVVLLHGITCSSDDFTMNIPGQGLAYVLADAGYDVWIPNARGNFYSRKHATKDPDKKSDEFWNFSWDTIGLVDYPAVFNYVRRLTGAKRIFLVAHSQGGSSLLALLSERQDINDMVAAASLMAPVAYLTHSDTFTQIQARLTPLWRLFKNSEFRPRGSMNLLSATFCNRISSFICQKIVNIMFGPSKNQRSDELLPIFLCHTPSGASINQLIHYGLLTKYKYFGPFKNAGESVPADFPLNQITAPLILHDSESDSLLSRKDINMLIQQLYHRPNFEYHMVEGTFNHVDFIWGVNTKVLVYDRMMSFFDKHSHRAN